MFSTKAIQTEESLFSASKTPVSDLVLEDESIAQFFTGLTKEKRTVLYDFLGEAKHSLQLLGRKEGAISGNVRSMSIQCQFLLTLVILRRNKTYKECGYLFHVSVSEVSEIFRTWLQFINCKFRDMRQKMFLHKADLPKPLPSDFNNALLRDVMLVIDCTEFGCEMSTNYDQQGNTFSPYKHKNTYKALLGVTPTGFGSYVSDCFEGRISDRMITQKSDLLDFIKEGDVILADRGFNCDDLFAAKGARLIVPPHLSGKDKFTVEEESIATVIAKARIHVERFNQRVKVFKYVSDPIPLYKAPLISQAVFVCCMLANMSKMLNNK